MTMTWSVELSGDAARVVREAPPVVRGRLAGLLNQLESSGVPENAEPAAGNYLRLRTAGIEALLTVDTQERRILVVRLMEDREHPTRNALRTASLPPVLSTRLARWLEEIGSDVRTSVRSLRRSPGFLLSVLATLAVAFGGTIGLAGLADTVFNGTLPFEEDDRLLRLRDRQVTAGGDPRIFNMSPLNFTTLRDEASSLAGVVAAGGSDHVLTGGEVAQRVNMIQVSEGWLDLLGVSPVLGRPFSAEEERLGPDAQVVLLSYGLWEDRFGGDPGIIGRSITYDGGVLTVVGIMPPRFRYPYDADLWTPWRWDPSNGTSHDFNVVGRMAEGATLASVRSELERIALRLQDARPDTNTDMFLNAESLRGDFIRDEDEVLLALMAAVGFLLLLACVNVTNLFVARFVSRRREVGIRAALGAGRLREIRGFLVEAVVVFGTGGLLGLGLALWLGDVLAVLVPEVMRSQLAMSSLAPTPGLLAFSLAVAVTAGVVFGLLAALKGTRTNVAAVLREGGRGASREGAGVQLALLVGAGVLFDHFERLRSDDLGFAVEELYTLRVSVGQERFTGVDARLDVVERLTAALAALPETEAVGFSSVNPLCCGDWGAPLDVEGVEQPEGSTHLIHHRYVGSGYFEATGTPLVRGRDFDRRDGPETAPVVIVDEALAERFWPGEDPIGRRVRIDRPGFEWRTVVGVVGDVEEEGDYSETWYLPHRQSPTARGADNLHFMLRAADAAVLDASRRAVTEVDPTLAVYAGRSMASLRSENIAQDRLGATVGLLFAGFGLLLAGLGVFGMLSYNVQSRRREIGTRLALGARPEQVTSLVLGGALKLTAVGGVIGIAAASGLNRLLAGMVFGIETAGPWLLSGLTAVLGLVAVVAALLPALRAARVDPIEVLSD